MIKLLGHVITPTFFPDKTSQVWKLSDTLIRALESSEEVTIYWDFKNEAELIHVAQLNDLLRQQYLVRVNLDIPYLPYGRQDKHYGNDKTFALNTFADMINMMKFGAVFTIDAHSNVAAHLINRLVVYPAVNYCPTGNNKELKVLCYPDRGAADRYTKQFPENVFILLEKKRNQLTGEIEGLEFAKKAGVDGYTNDTIMLVDDICDGGRTFVEAAKLLHTLKPKEIHLYVSHGIFSKGLNPLIDAGITRIFTHKGEVDVKNYYTNTIEEA